jgi:hypothetical protein
MFQRPVALRYKYKEHKATLDTLRARVWSSGIYGGQSGAGASFLRVLRFPLPIFIPLIAPQSPSSIIWGCTIGQKWPQYLVT